MTFQTVQMESSKPGPSGAKSFLATSPAEEERQCDVLLGGELWDELAELEDEAEVVSTEGAAFRLGHGVASATVEPDLSARRDKDSGQTVKEGRLPRAAWTHKGKNLPGGY
jgi:hypothetical protein